jgi:hypothetical protein
MQIELRILCSISFMVVLSDAFSLRKVCKHLSRTVHTMLSSFVCVTEVKNINQVMKTPESISVQSRECQPPQLVTKLPAQLHVW